MSVKAGDKFLTKTMKVRVEDVKDETVTYSVWSTNPRSSNIAKRILCDTVETFEKRFPADRRKS